jgi:hypothetical protein
MRQIFLFCALLSFAICVGQNGEEIKKYTIDVSPFYGSVLLHNPDISHLVSNHPAGFILSYNRKTYGSREWEALYKYPDYGASFIYQNMNNETLGNNFGVYAHYNFYFFKRNIQFRIGQGLAYNTNPYDKNTNFRNNAYGSDFMSSTYLMLNYHKENIFKGLGFKAGVSVMLMFAHQIPLPIPLRSMLDWFMTWTAELSWLIFLRGLRKKLPSRYVTI